MTKEGNQLICVQAMVGGSGGVMVVVGATLGTHGAHGRHTNSVRTLKSLLLT